MKRKITKFTCTHCKKKLDLKEKVYWSPSQGEVCNDCFTEIIRIWMKNYHNEKSMKKTMFWAIIKERDYSIFDVLSKKFIKLMKELDLIKNQKKTKIKFVYQKKLLKTRDVCGVDKGEVDSIINNLSKSYNIPVGEINVEFI